MSKHVHTVFRYRGAASVSGVALVGSWDEWAEQMAMKRDDTDVTLWELARELEPGHFTFKFVVDGKWTTGKEYPVEADGFGGGNNVVEVAAEPKGEETSEHETNGTMEMEDGEDDEKLGMADGKEEMKGEDSGCVVC